MTVEVTTAWQAEGLLEGADGKLVVRLESGSGIFRGYGVSEHSC